MSLRGMLAGGLLLAVGLQNVGCQTYQVGQVLPSAAHMRDDLFYARKGPQFPLQHELDAMQQAEAERPVINP